MKYLAITIMLVICMPLFSADDVPLPPDAAKLVDGAAKAFTEIETKALLSKLDTLTALIPKLTKAQDTATKAGKLEVSLAIKSKIDEYRKQVDEITALRKPAEAPLVLSGIYAFNFAGSGHMGTLELKETTAKEVKTNIRGGLTQNGNEYVILWSNNTQWTITRTGNDLSMSSSDGESKLTKVGK